jgi:hypothetical protein
MTLRKGYPLWVIELAHLRIASWTSSRLGTKTLEMAKATQPDCPTVLVQLETGNVLPLIQGSPHAQT